MADKKLYPPEEDNLCRVCMVKTGKKRNGPTIFDQIEDGVKIHQFLEQICHLQNLANDAFTKKICKKCADEITFLYTSLERLKSKSKESEEKLKAMVIPHKIEIVDVDIKEESEDDDGNGFDFHDSIFDRPQLACSNPPVKAMEESNRESPPKTFRCPPTLSKKFQYCCQCTLSFPSEQDVAVHFEKAHADKVKRGPPALPIDLRKTQCTLCLSLVFNLRRHRRQKYYAERRRELCKHCGKRFETRVGWLMCCDRGYENTEFQCSICSKTFDKKRHLKVHLKKHMGVTFKCEVCQKEMTRKGALKVHMQRHNKELNYDCQYCAKAFVSKQGLHHLLKKLQTTQT